MTLLHKMIVLKKRSDYLSVASSGQKWVARRLVLQVRADSPSPSFSSSSEKINIQEESQDLGTSLIRIGFTATKKIGGAVVRNRAKRRLRALARDILLSHACKGLDYVLIARLDTPSCSYEELKADLQWSLKKLKLWRE